MDIPKGTADIHTRLDLGVWHKAMSHPSSCLFCRLQCKGSYDMPGGTQAGLQPVPAPAMVAIAAWPLRLAASHSAWTSLSGCAVPMLMHELVLPEVKVFPGPNRARSAAGQGETG